MKMLPKAVNRWWKDNNRCTVHQTFYDINFTIKYCNIGFNHCSSFGIFHNHLSDCWSKFLLTWTCAILLSLFPIPLSWIGYIVRVVYDKMLLYLSASAKMSLNSMMIGQTIISFQNRNNYISFLSIFFFFKSFADGLLYWHWFTCRQQQLCINFVMKKKCIGNQKRSLCDWPSHHISAHSGRILIRALYFVMVLFIS